MALHLFLIVQLFQFVTSFKAIHMALHWKIARVCSVTY